MTGTVSAQFHRGTASVKAPGSLGVQLHVHRVVATQPPMSRPTPMRNTFWEQCCAAGISMFGFGVLRQMRAILATPQHGSASAACYCGSDMLQRWPRQSACNVRVPFIRTKLGLITSRSLVGWKTRVGTRSSPPRVYDQSAR